MRNWLLVGVSILDQLKDELHLVLVVPHRDFLVDSMDTEGRSIWGGGDKGQMMYVAQELAQNTLPGSPPPPIWLIFGSPGGQGDHLSAHV